MKTVINEKKKITNVKRITMVVFDSTRRLEQTQTNVRCERVVSIVKEKTINMRYILRHAVSKTNKINPLPTFRSPQIALLSDSMQI